MKHFSDRLHPTTRLAVQVVVALILVKTVTELTHLPRPYWGYITVVSVLCQSWGESLRKSTQRIFATIAGLMLGVVFNIPFEHTVWIKIVFLLTGLFYMSYYATVSYARSIFFMSFMLTMIFASSGQLTSEIVYARILQTLAGAAIAILTGITVLRAHPKDDLRKAVTDFLHIAADAYTETFNLLVSDTAPEIPHPTKIHLQHEYKILRDKSDTFFREASLLRAPALQAHRLINTVQSISFYHTNLRHTAYGNRNNPACTYYKEEMRQINAILCHNFTILDEHANNNREHTPQSLDTLRDRINEKLTTLTQDHPEMRADILDLIPVFYFARKVNQRILDFCSRSN